MMDKEGLEGSDGPVLRHAGAQERYTYDSISESGKMPRCQDAKMPRQRQLQRQLRQHSTSIFNFNFVSSVTTLNL